MSAQVIALAPRAQPVARRIPLPDDRQALLAAITDLHALITIDPILGASPVRVYFVLSPDAKARITAMLRVDDAAAGDVDAYALVAYDFPFALRQFATVDANIPQDRARAIISSNAALQRGTLERAAQALGVEAHVVIGFDAQALKQSFLPNTGETVTDLMRLALRRT